MLVDEVKSTARIISAIFAIGFVFLALNSMSPWMFEYHELKPAKKIGRVFGRH